MTKRDLQRNRIAAIAACLDGSSSCREIADAWAVSEARVRQIQHEFGGTLRPVKRGAQGNEKLPEVIAALDGSATRQEICARFDVSRSWLRKVALAHGGSFKVDPRDPQAGNGQWQPRSPKGEQALTLIRQGMNYSQIGTQLGLSRERIRQYAARAGVAGSRAWAVTRPPLAAKLAAERAIVAARKAARVAREHSDVTLLRTLMTEGSMSIAAAGRAAGFTRGRVHYLARRSDLGQITTYGRWRKYRQKGRVAL